MATLAQGFGTTEKREETTRYRVVIKGVVQGVGFRPFVYNLAQIHGIKGSVLNSSLGVIIEAEGEEKRIERFLWELKERPPRLSRIIYYHHETLPPCGYSSFEILESARGKEKDALVPPDVAVCPDCAREVWDQQDRHFRYPFTNCANCGPRFTIIEEVPYDRPKTSMAGFAMCDRCADAIR